MRLPPRFSTRVLLCCAAVIVATAFGQSLSIIRTGGSEVLVEATVPADTRYVLQVSNDLKNWTDVNDQIWGWFSYRFDEAGVTLRFFRLILWAEPPPPITIVLLGDSTVADLVSNANWFSGWGQGIYGYFKPEAQVVNLAYPCYSSGIIFGAAEKWKMLAIKPAFVLVQFGLVDSVGCEGFNKTTMEEYSNNLREIVRIIRGFGGVPILITPPTWRRFDARGRVEPVLKDRSAVVLSVATELETHLVDLNQLTSDLFNRLGRQASAYISCDRDEVHYSLEGAEVIAGLVVKALPCELEKYLVQR